MIKRLAILAALLLAVTGCTQFLTSVSISPQAMTLSIVESQGGATARWQVDSDGAVTIDFGDGSALMELSVHGRVLVSHLYETVGQYTAVFRAKAGFAQSVVTVRGVAPQAFPLWVPQGYNADKYELLCFHIPYRERGCEEGTGLPLFVSGVKPGEGAAKFMLLVFNENNEPVSVFRVRMGVTGETSPWHWNGASVVIENVVGEWVDLEEPIETSLQRLYVFAGWTGEEPRTVIWPDTRALSTMDCGDDTCLPDPWDPTPVITPQWMDFRLYVADEFFPFDAANPIVATWRIYIGTEGVCD